MTRDKHSWLRPVRIARVPGRTTELLDGFVADVVSELRGADHTVVDQPDDAIDAFLTTARFGEPLDWRESLLFTGRKRFRLKTKPVLFTVVGIRPAELEAVRARFEEVLLKEPPDPADYRIDGLAPRAYEVLFDQGRRGGPLMSIARMVQGQYKTLRAVLLVGDERPEAAYMFDLAGSHPRCIGKDARSLAADVATRIATALSTRELVEHEIDPRIVPHRVWQSLATPPAVLSASRKLGERRFFTRLVHIADLVVAPALTDAVAKQYSEGCFATWEPDLQALITTVTGSRNPVEKGAVTENDLAVVTTIAEKGAGVVARHVEGLRNDPPSSEAVELVAMDAELPRIRLSKDWGIAGEVPIVRSKLHGHRGVASFDPHQVEYVPLSSAYHNYPVSCSTEAQARGVCAAFARSQALNDPRDPREIVFTVLPGHGIVLVEKWVAGKRPFQLLIEAMDSGVVTIEDGVPQGPLDYVKDDNGRRNLRRVAASPARLAAAVNPR